jgi:hypothetical protein
MTPRIKARIKHYKLLGKILSKTRPDNSAGKVGCVLWLGRRHSDEWGFYEYGALTVAGKRVGPHRILWEEKFGPLEGRKLVNTCGNTLCVAPDHWTPVGHWTEAKRAQAEKIAKAG